MFYRNSFTSTITPSPFETNRYKNKKILYYFNIKINYIICYIINNYIIL